VIQPLARVGDVRGSLSRRIEEMTASGGTNIPSGLRRGREVLAQAKASNVRRVVLVSDGLDASRHDSESLASDLSEHGVTTSSLGVGLDFDEGYMSAIAARGHGNFAFAKDGASVARFLDRELRETASTVVDGATVSVKLPRDIELVRAIGADAKVVDGEVLLRVGSLFSGDERRVLLELRSDGRSGQDGAISVHAEWRLAGSTTLQKANAEGPSFAFVTDSALAEGSRDGETYARVVSVLATERQMAASEAYAKGDSRKGAALIEENRRELRAAASALPAPMAAPLRKQESAYSSDALELGSGGDRARAAPKAMMMRESGNADRKTSY
jgi:Ca-activated chloride channel homolog